MLHTNNSRGIVNPAHLPKIWHGVWHTSGGNEIHGRINFALYELLIQERALANQSPS